MDWGAARAMANAAGRGASPTGSPALMPTGRTSGAQSAHVPGIDRMHALANYSRFLSANPAPRPVARAMVLGALAPVQCTGVFIFIAEQHPDHAHAVLNVLSTYGFSDAEVATFSVLPLDLPLPVTESVTSGRVVVTEGAQVVELFPLLQAPDLQAALPKRMQTSTLVCLPLVWQGIPIGACSLFAAPEAVRSLDDLEYLQAVADVSALWLAARGGAEDPHPTGPPPMLTERQRQVLHLLGHGRSNGEIAAQLGYSVPTIKKDVQRIMALCGVRTRKDVPAKAEKFGLL